MLRRKINWPWHRRKEIPNKVPPATSSGKVLPDVAQQIDDLLQSLPERPSPPPVSNGYACFLICEMLKELYLDDCDWSRVTTIAQSLYTIAYNQDAIKRGY